MIYYLIKKNLRNFTEVINFNQFDYLIIGIGLNTNIDPQNKSFKSTCLKNILKKGSVTKKF